MSTRPLRLFLNLPTRAEALDQAYEHTIALGACLGPIKDLAQGLDAATATGDRAAIAVCFTQLLALANTMPAVEAGHFYAAVTAWATFYIVDSANTWGTCDEVTA